MFLLDLTSLSSALFLAGLVLRQRRGKVFGLSIMWEQFFIIGEIMHCFCLLRNGEFYSRVNQIRLEIVFSL